jgi:hypothetical protein
VYAIGLYPGVAPADVGVAHAGNDPIRRLGDASTGNDGVATLEDYFGAGAIEEIRFARKMRDFYIEMCKLECWSVRTLRERMASMLYGRTAPGKNIRNEPARLRDEEKMTPEHVAWRGTLRGGARHVKDTNPRMPDHVWHPATAMKC